MRIAPSGRAWRELASWGACLAVALAAAAHAAEDAPAPGDPAIVVAESMPRAAESLILDAVATTAGWVAVGERGHILRSADGERWELVSAVPTRSTLNAVAVAGEQLWAAGHDGVILHSPDGGATWEHQRVDVWTPDALDPTAGAPILDLLFLDAERGFAVGAYSLLLATADGGRTWEQVRLPAPAAAETKAGGRATADADDWTFSEKDLQLEAVADPHLNAIARTEAGELFIVAERGAAFRSRDEGRTWERIALPYGGSMFGALAWEGGHVLAFGLQGRAFETRDLGQTWTELPTGLRSMLMGGLALPEGAALLVGAQGAVLHRAGAEQPLEHSVYVNGHNETPILAGLLAGPQQEFVVFGERGLGRYRTP